MSGYTDSPAALILRHDVISTIRGSSRRMMDHLFTTVFAILLIIPFMAAITGIMIFIFTEDTIFSDLVTPGDFFLTVYIIVSGRALSTTVRHVYKNPTTELLRITPISAAYIYRGKIQSVMVLNLLTFSLFFAGFLSFFLLMYQDPISASLLAYYILYLYLIAIFSTLSGFSIPLLYFLQGTLRLRTLAFVAPIIFGGGIILSYSDLGGSFNVTGSSLLFPMLLLFFTILLYLVVRGMDWYFNEAIHTYAPYSSFEREQVPRLVELIRFLCPKEPVSCEESSHTKIMASKEVLGSMRDSYFIIYAAMTAILTVMGVMMVLSMPQEFLDSDWGWLVFPVAISFFLYIEGSFMVTLGSISLIGKEGRRLWILRSLPVSGSDVLTGKAISVIIFPQAILNWRVCHDDTTSLPDAASCRAEHGLPRAHVLHHLQLFGHRYHGWGKISQFLRGIQGITGYRFPDVHSLHLPHLPWIHHHSSHDLLL